MTPFGGVRLTVASLCLGDLPATTLTVGLAGAVQSEGLLRSVLPWLGGLVGLAVAGCVILMILKRQLQREESSDAPFTLDALRELHRAGKLTDDEFKLAKERILGGARAMAARERERRATQPATRRRSGGPAGAEGSADERRS